MAQFSSWATKTEIECLCNAHHPRTGCCLYPGTGARPIGIGRDHTKSFNPVNVKNVSHNCNGRNSISTTQTEYSFMFNFIPLFTIKAFLIMVPLQPIEFILHYSCRYISGWLYLCSYKLELSIERSICSFMRHLGEVSTMLICQGLMERRQV